MSWFGTGAGRGVACVSGCDGRLGRSKRYKSETDKHDEQMNAARHYAVDFYRFKGKQWTRYIYK